MSHRIKKVLKTSGIVLLMIFAILLLGILVARGITKEQYRIRGKNSICEYTYTDINGFSQYILIKGEDIGNPVILWLHGGPGSPDSFEDYRFIKNLTDEYTVVAYDQRGCGATYFKNIDIDPDNETTGFEQAIEDVDALVDYLCRRFNQEKIIIVGHSYGTILGTNYVTRHQDKVKCYIGVGTAVSPVKGYIAGYEDAMNIAQTRGENTSKLEEAYNSYIKTPNLENLQNLRITAAPYHKGKKEKNSLCTIVYCVLSPDLRFSHIRWYLKALDMNGFYRINRNLMDAVSAEDCDLIREAGTAFEMPVGLINGSADWYTPASMVSDYFEEIKAPQKAITIMEECGHMVAQSDDPEGFAAELKEMLDAFQ